ncbi:MAG TPA: HlyC/CorC family transporter [Alphaproteobacteria bacterium]|nr:HlyC/CorC family transporter [Alphaproteobacteria bacterium]
MDIDLTLGSTVAGIVVLLVASAFFSASETAITGASRPRMHALEEQGNARARTVNQLHRAKERLIGAILLGNNLANILASALATSLLIDFFGPAGIAYATVAMTVLVVLFAEVIPKSYALHDSDRVALATAPVLRVVVWLLAPVTRGMALFVRAVLALFGLRLDMEIAGAQREEELRGAIELHRGPEPETVQERRMLRSVLDLDEVEVGEVMIHRKNVTAIDADLPMRRIVELALESDFSRIPLWRNDPDNIVGVVHAKPLLKEVIARRGDLDALDVGAIMSKPWFIPESTSLLDQLQAFRKRHEHIALVVDEYGALMGIVTLEDILEEIVGDITDELDESVQGARAEPGGSYLVGGAVTIRDLNREFDWGLPDEEAATLAGLVMHEARMIPDVGQTFTFFGFRFEIVRRQRNQITQIRVTPPPLESGK